VLIKSQVITDKGTEAQVQLTTKRYVSPETEVTVGSPGGIDIGVSLGITPLILDDRIIKPKMEVQQTQEVQG
jgi:hypothetical protein